MDERMVSEIVARVVKSMTTAKQAQKVLDNAAACGAQELITACPLCMYNLTENTDGRLPVRYFTELLAEALGVKEAAQ